MEYRNLGSSGLKVSRLCLGALLFGGATSREDSIKIIHRAMDEGINFIDTADVYVNGESERIVGEAIRERRKEVILATKVGEAMGNGPNDAGLSRHYIMKALDASLNRLNTDYVDVYFLHLPDYNTSIEESLRTLDDLVRQGKVRYIGCSNFYAWQLIEAIAMGDRMNLEKFVCAQPLYNIVNRDIEVEFLPVCKKYGIGVASYSPLARGVLTGKYHRSATPPEGSRAARKDRRIYQTEWREESFDIAEQLKHLAEAHGKTISQFALNWVLANTLITSVIIGPRTMEQLEDNLGALGWSFTHEDEKAIDKLVPPGEHTGMGFNDPNFPVRGRPTAT